VNVGWLRACDTKSYVRDLSRDAIFNDTERPLTKISKARHYSTYNISETVQDRDMVTMEY